MLARLDAGLDFDGTGFAFLESTPFLAAVLLATVAWYTATRARVGEAWLERGALALALVAGGLLGAGAAAAGGLAPAVGAAIAVASALLGHAAASGVMRGARRRLDEGDGSLLPAFADAAALALTALAAAFPPAGLVAVALLGWLALRSRREAGRRYEGLRVLR